MGGIRLFSGGSRKRVALTIALVYLLLLRALMLPFPAGSTLDAGLFSAFPICSDASGSAPDDQGGNPASHHDCCDGDCCLMRLADLPPLLLVAALIIFVPLLAETLVFRVRRRIGAALWRIAWRPQTQRGPPSLALV